MKIIVRLFGRRIRDVPVRKFVVATEADDKTVEDFYVVLKSLQELIPFEGLLRYEPGATGSILFTAPDDRLTPEVVRTIRATVEEVLAKI